MTSQPDEQPAASGTDSPSGIQHPIYNWMSMIGGAIAACSVTATIFLAGLGLVSGGESGYAGLLLIFPVALSGLGFGLLLAGYLRERRRQQQGRQSSFFERTVIDPFHVVSRMGFAALLAGFVVATFALLAGGAGSLAVVEFSESNQFCGQMCHDVMGPEATVYEDSTHAQIHCVECHVGPGPESYVQAKIGGMRQLWAVTTGDVSRPIPTPIHGRRPADEMCGGCHNRERFIGYKAITRTYFPAGESREPMKLGMLIKVGGGRDHLMGGSGIHYHMLLAKKVEFVARDPKRQEIAWVRVVRQDGEVKEYSSEDAPLTDEERNSLPVREMECLDCHSRPAHKFWSPIDSVNQALAVGAISPEIPHIKEAAVRALDGNYETTQAALAGIEEKIQSFYEEEHEDVLESSSEDLEKAVATLRSVYQRTIFPEMKADWRAHPDNLGHRDSPGCFRCHNDTMLDEDGEALVTDCVTCHAVLAQDESVIRTVADLDVGRKFVHPEDAESFDEFTLCSECHTGGAALYD